MSQPGGYTIAPGKEWTDAAATWPVTVVSRETEPGHFMTDIVPVRKIPPLMQLHLACAVCPEHPSVFCLSPNLAASAYRLTGGDLLAGILGHIRRSHPDVVAS